MPAYKDILNNGTITRLKTHKKDILNARLLPAKDNLNYGTTPRLKLY